MSPSWTVEQTSSVSPSWTVDQTPSGAGFLSFEKESSKLVQARTFSEEDTPRVVSAPVGPGEEKAAGITSSVSPSGLREEQTSSVSPSWNIVQMPF